MSRRLSREYAIQFLFSMDFNKDEAMDSLISNFFDMKETASDDDQKDMLSVQDKQFTLDIIKGSISNLDEIDKVIQSNAIGWKKDRLAKVDLAILRLAVYEILYRDDIPESVTANEAIEMAKKYSTDESSSFVNGIIGKVIKDTNKVGI